MRGGTKFLASNERIWASRQPESRAGHYRMDIYISGVELCPRERNQFSSNMMVYVIWPSGALRKFHLNRIQSNFRRSLRAFFRTVISRSHRTTVETTVILADKLLGSSLGKLHRVGSNLFKYFGVSTRALTVFLHMFLEHRTGPYKRALSTPRRPRRSLLTPFSCGSMESLSMFSRFVTWKITRGNFLMMSSKSGYL